MKQSYKPTILALLILFLLFCIAECAPCPAQNNNNNKVTLKGNITNEIGYSIDAVMIVYNISDYKTDTIYIKNKFTYTLMPRKIYMIRYYNPYCEDFYVSIDTHSPIAQKLKYTVAMRPLYKEELKDKSNAVFFYNDDAHGYIYQILR